MKLFLFLILVLPLSAQKSFQFELINEKDIPALGEKTEHERALAKSLNKIIKRWNANGNSDDYQSRYSGYIKPYNDALAECKISETENIYYGCMKDKIKSISLYFIADSMGYEANQINIDPVPTAKALKTCAQILNSKFFLQKADDYVSYNASGMKHFVVTKYQGTAGVSYFYHKAVDMDANESIFSIRNLIGDVDFDPMDEDWVGIYRKPLNANGVKMFSWNDTIYMSINNRDKSEYDIYVYDKESRFFDHACEIKRKITGYKNSEKICRQVIKGGYEKIAPAPLSSVMNDEQVKQFNFELNITGGSDEYWDWNKMIKKYAYTYFHSENNNSYFIDYRNEGKKHAVLNLEYASGAGAGCGYEFLAVYNANESDKIRYIDEKNDIDDYHPSVFSDCAVETKEEIISIGGKNYILVSGTAGLIGLYEIGVSDEGEDIVHDICIFEPIYVYE